LLQLNLCGQQLLDRFRSGEGPTVDALQDHIECLQRAGHAEVGQNVPQPIAA